MAKAAATSGVQETFSTYNFASAVGIGGVSVDRKAISCKSDALVSTLATGMLSLVHTFARNKMAKIGDGLKWKNFVRENLCSCSATNIPHSDFDDVANSPSRNNRG
jgi:hypothetical protein